MTNKHRGEIAARLDGAEFRLCLTLGALADLEAAFGDTDLVALASAVRGGAHLGARLSAHHRRGAAWRGLRDFGDAVGAMQVGRRRAGYVDIVARLLSATFSGGKSRGQGATRLGPFPGTT